MTGSMTISKDIVSIFGGTGDLTYRKLLPAFYNLFKNNGLPDHFHVVVIGRRQYTTEEYRELAKPWIKKHSRFKVDEDKLDTFLKQVSYFEMTFTEDEGYPRLKTYLNSLCPEAKLLYYFAVAPKHFEIIAKKLDQHHGADNSKIIIEKPFGNDLQSATSINKTLTQIFGASNIYRIDHYVGKEMIQNIFTIRFANALFKNNWDRDAIHSIQISANERVGVESRGGYYDQTGALKDMIQNHLLQILSIVTMEEPETLEAESIHLEQEKVLESVFIENYATDIALGQYTQNEDSASYVKELNVDPNSKTETFAALKLGINLPRWKGVPIYMRTGKRMHKQSTEVVIEFKALKEEEPNVLIIKIQPDEGVYLRFTIKKPGTTHETQTVLMDFCQSCIIENRLNTPEAYERLLQACLQEDRSLFRSFKQVEHGWSFIETILEQKNGNLYPYPAYTNGPTESDDLLAKDGNRWIEETVLGEL